MTTLEPKCSERPNGCRQRPNAVRQILDRFLVRAEKWFRERERKKEKEREREREMESRGRDSTVGC